MQALAYAPSGQWLAAETDDWNAKREQWETTHAFSDVLEDLGHHPTLGVIDIFDAKEYLKVKPASM